MSGTTTANATKHIIGWVEPLEATRLPSPCGSPLTRRSELSLAVGTACCSLVGNSPLVRSSMFACTARRSRRSGRPGHCRPPPSTSTFLLPAPAEPHVQLTLSGYGRVWVRCLSLS